MNNSCLNHRISTLVSIEQQVISYYSQSETYRKEFYENCFDSLVPLSENGSAAFLLKNHNNVYLGVKRTAEGVCEGCMRKRSIRYKQRDRQIRMFIGNQEVDDFITDNTRILVFFSVSVARYPSPDAPFEVTAVTVGSYSFLSSKNQICTTVHASPNPLSLAGSLRLRHLYHQWHAARDGESVGHYPSSQARNDTCVCHEFIRLPHQSPAQFGDPQHPDIALHGAGHGPDAQSQPAPRAGETASLAEEEPTECDHSAPLLFRPCADSPLLLATGGLSAAVGFLPPFHVATFPSYRKTRAILFNAWMCICAWCERSMRVHTYGSSSSPMQLYVMPSWFGVPKESPVSQMECALTDFQEPYDCISFWIADM